MGHVKKDCCTVHQHMCNDMETNAFYSIQFMKVSVDVPGLSKPSPNGSNVSRIGRGYPAYLYDVMGVILCSFPAAQLYTVVKIAPTRTRLRTKQEILRIQLMRGGQSEFGGRELVPVPVNTDSMNIASGVDVAQNLQRQIQTYLHQRLQH